jgi:cyanophycinase
MKTAFYLSIILLAAPLAAEPVRNGHLVAIGGALDYKRPDLYQRMQELAGGSGTFLILPTASGVPEESGPNNVSDFTSHGVSATVVDITSKNPTEASNPEKVAQIAAAKGIFFTGGVQSRIIEAFRPASGDTTGHGALQTALRNGAVIGGTSAGAAMMSDPCIYWGVSDEALLIGTSAAEDRGVSVGRGMGFFPYGMTDQHFLRRGRLGRLIAAMEATSTRFGFGIEEDRALHANLATDQLEALNGPAAVLVVDREKAEQDGLRRSNIRLSLLSHGDDVNGLDGKVTPDAARSGTLIPSSDFKGEKALGQKMWDRAAVTEAFALIARDRLAAVTAEDEAFNFRLSVDELSAISASADSETSTAITAVSLRFDIEPKALATQKRDYLLATTKTSNP